MAQETWTTRDLPVLDWLVGHFNSGGYSLSPEEVAAAVEIDQAAVQLGLRSLQDATPPYIKGTDPWRSIGPMVVTGVTERALAATGAWSGSADSPARLAEALAALAEREPEGPEKTKLQRAAAAVGGVGQAALNAAISAAVGAAMT